MRVFLAFLFLLSQNCQASTIASYKIFCNQIVSQDLDIAINKLQNVFLIKTGYKLKRQIYKPKTQSEYSIYIGYIPLSQYKYKNNKYDGYVIEFYNKNIFIYGNDTPAFQNNEQGGRFTGTINGVYAFISRFLDEKINISENLQKQDISIINWSNNLIIQDSSPFLYRVLAYLGKDQKVSSWTKQMLLGKPYPVEHGHAWHYTIPKYLYKKYPSWFADPELLDSKKYKLETTNSELVQAYANHIIDVFDKNPNKKWYSLSPSDGGSGWSESEATKTLLEKDKHGNISRTKLILNFYNNIAKIVYKKYPNHKLGGLLYASYLYPPSSGIPPIMPNISLVLAPSFAYGFRLYRDDVKKEWLELIQIWGRDAKKQGYDIYYYDLPTWIKSTEDKIITPPAPQIINFIFKNIYKYNFKGAYIYGCSNFRKCGISNYMIAKMMWNPSADANSFYQYYISNYYGQKYSTLIEEFYSILDASYKKYCEQECNYNLSEKDVIRLYKIFHEKFNDNFIRKVPENDKFEYINEFLESIKLYDSFGVEVFWDNK